MSKSQGAQSGCKSNARPAATANTPGCSVATTLLFIFPFEVFGIDMDRWVWRCNRSMQPTCSPACAELESSVWNKHCIASACACSPAKEPQSQVVALSADERNPSNASKPLTGLDWCLPAELPRMAHSQIFPPFSLLRQVWFYLSVERNWNRKCCRASLEPWWSWSGSRPRLCLWWRRLPKRAGRDNLWDSLHIGLISNEQ